MLSKSWRNRLCKSILVLGLSFNPGIFAQNLQEQTWNFENVEIETIINKISEQTGKNFVVDPRVQGKVTLISHKPINADEAYEVFLSILQVYGFSAVESGQVIKIMPRNEALQSNTPFVQRTPQTDALVTKVIPLSYISAQELYPTLKPLIPNTSYMTANVSSNHLIITDIASNVEKIEKIVRQMDRSSSNSLTNIPVHHASAVALAETLNNMIQQKRGAQSLPIAVGADERTNTLLLAGGSRDLHDYIRDVVSQLDIRSDTTTNSEVIYLRYLQASDAALIVANFIEEALKSSKEQVLHKEIEETGQATTTTMTTAPITGPKGNYDNGFINKHLQALKNYGVNEGAQGSLYQENENAPKSGVINRFVQWEETTNAIIVKAPPELMRSVKNIIAKLDIKRPQILIEVIIAEVNLDRLQDFGVEWQAGGGDVQVGTRFFGALNGGIVGGFNNTASVPLLGSGLSVGIFRHGTIQALLRALSTDTTANIVSTPTLVTLDNQIAMIKVGQKVPFAIGQTNNENVGGNPFTSYDREEVGLSLTIRPQITEPDELKLEIESILSNIVPGSANPDTGNNPTTSERTLVTNVMVQDSRILVLGGLTQDTWQKTRSKLPFLGNVPLLRFFAGRENKELVKTNLMIFLKPTILYDQCRTAMVTSSKYNRMRLQEYMFNDALERPFPDEPPMLKNEFSKGPDVDPQVVLPLPFEEPRDIFYPERNKRFFCSKSKKQPQRQALPPELYASKSSLSREW